MILKKCCKKERSELENKVVEAFKIIQKIERIKIFLIKNFQFYNHHF